MIVAAYIDNSHWLVKKNMVDNRWREPDGFTEIREPPIVEQAAPW
ncbi:MAG: hypothetical protein ACXWMJ_01555 [Syntrophales bacterium]